MSTGQKRPGTHMISAAAILLFALGLGLLAVSFAAQYRYVMTQRHQSAASLIEAAALDVGMVIFSLLALGLARAGLPAKAERGLIIACAAGSAVMNYAAADVSSPRSVLAFCMPPVFLAIVADRVVVTVRRHVLGMREGRSPWSAAARVTLYGLRFALDPVATAVGVRRLVLAAVPLHSAVTADDGHRSRPVTAAVSVTADPEPAEPVTQPSALSRPRTQRRPARNASAERQRRYRLHSKDDHSLCVAGRCPAVTRDLETARAEGTMERFAIPEPVNVNGNGSHAQ